MKTFNQFYVEMASNSIKSGIRSKIGNEIGTITKGFHKQIPFSAIQGVIEKYGYELVQEDGTPWSGFLVGGAECGSPEAAKQRATIDIVKKDDRTPVNNALILMWCKMPSGNYEVVSYIS
jgi:hypothetical protein